MAFEITSDTVVKILVRRGLEVERLETLLSEGELGLSVDSRRLFIGDGYTLGGTPVGNINFGIVSNLADVTPYAQSGDMANRYNLNFVFSNNGWSSVSPVTYLESNNNTLFEPATVEYSPAPLNGLRISQTGLGDGLLVDYSQGANGNVNYTIQQAYGMTNFDARFLSLCAFRTVYDLNDGPRVGSLYFGNIFTSTIKDNLSSTVNVEKNLSINDHTLSAYQLQMYARNPYVNNSLIDATSGSLYLRSKGPIYLGTGTSGGSGLSISDTNVTVYGNLSVLGDLAYLNSVVSVTSALSVVNNGTGPAFVVNQKGTQPVAHFQDDGATALYIADGGKVGIGTTNPSVELEISNGTVNFQVDPDTTTSRVIIGPSTNHALAIQTNAGTKMTLDTSGKLGIGTTLPGELLTVSGNISSNGTLYTQSITSRGIDLIHLPVTDGIDPILRIGESNYGTGYNGFSGAFMAYDELTNTFGISSVFADTQWGIPAIAIDRAGKVGIGTDLPTQKLTVSGNISVDGNITIGGDSTLGDAGTDTTIIRGIAKIADSSATNGLLFGTGNASYDVNLYRNSSSNLKTDNNFTVGGTTTLNSTVTLADAVNIVLNTSTGSKIGTATTQKLSFYNSTPIVQPSSASQAAVVTTAPTQTTPWGFTTSAQAAAIITLVNEIRTTLVNLGLMKGSA